MPNKLFDLDPPDTPAASREREPPKPGTPEALLRSGNHREVALGALRRGHLLNNWERDFAISMTHATRLTLKQAEKLLLIAGKAALPRPRPPAKRRRRSRQ